MRRRRQRVALEMAPVSIRLFRHTRGGVPSLGLLFSFVCLRPPPLTPPLLRRAVATKRRASPEKAVTANLEEAACQAASEEGRGTGGPARPGAVPPP